MLPLVQLAEFGVGGVLEPVVEDVGGDVEGVGDVVRVQLVSDGGEQRGPGEQPPCGGPAYLLFHLFGLAANVSVDDVEELVCEGAPGLGVGLSGVQPHSPAPVGVSEGVVEAVEDDGDAESVGCVPGAVVVHAPTCSRNGGHCMYLLLSHGDFAPISIKHSSSPGGVGIAVL